MKLLPILLFFFTSLFSDGDSLSISQISESNNIYSKNLFHCGFISDNTLIEDNTEDYKDNSLGICSENSIIKYVFISTINIPEFSSVYFYFNEIFTLIDLPPPFCA